MSCHEYRIQRAPTVAARRLPATPPKPPGARNSRVGPSPRTQAASHLRVKLLRARQELIERVHVSLGRSHDDVRVRALAVDDPPPLL